MSHEATRLKRLEVIRVLLKDKKSDEEIIIICCKKWGSSRRTILEYLKILKR